MRCLHIQVWIHGLDCLYGGDGYWLLSWRGIYTVCLSIKEPHIIPQVQHIYILHKSYPLGIIWGMGLFYWKTYSINNQPTWSVASPPYRQSKPWIQTCISKYLTTVLHYYILLREHFQTMLEKCFLTSWGGRAAKECSSLLLFLAFLLLYAQIWQWALKIRPNTSKRN